MKKGKHSTLNIQRRTMRTPRFWNSTVVLVKSDRVHHSGSLPFPCRRLIFRSVLNVECFL